ncbi:MAG TPA: GntR family transcriptional regulator [Thermopetrobacter sp.]|nr:GntR family transcriptional regulator [Thermopetrobacter sp.]
MSRAARRDETAVAPERIEASLARLMAAARAVPGRTKHSAVRLAIAQAIREGILRPGDRLPSEQRLTKILGVSLGTVQTALRQLQQTATIVRRRGDGTRVASREPLARDIWHFRFAAKSDGTPLRMVDEEVWIDRIVAAGDWAAFLGPCSAYLRIRRRLTMQNGTVVAAEMLLDAARVPGLDRVDPSELSMMNIRPYLETRFGILAGPVSHTVTTRRVTADEGTIFGLEVGADVFEILARVSSADGLPLYVQRILVPTAECVLTF